ncbi:zwei Ig domain protein zig-8-like isoform X1 [Homalodisca vitripennis]|uniref:zwei Ig domain protein zig-8-like isoform X1 n=1 Tax=Homalodisca vitripennis TaxID=197043 RepID=UPI001EEA0AB7|nr:zwei Ig domain protein zig-8-like isoform X1 [Homalodisca vitripennis]
MAVLDSCQFFVTLVLILFSSFSVTNGRSIIDEEVTDATINTNEHGDHLISQPYFENFYQRNVTITEGQSAYLHCRVKNLGNKTVAWVRVRDVHLLTLDNVTYTSDWRFRSIHDDDTDDWTLKIGFTKLRDSGIYLCQVNAEPWITQDFKLNVVEEEPSKTYGYTINGRSSSDTTATTLPSSSVKDSSNIPTTSTPRDDALIPPPLVIQ